jgi:hypothetical protein
MRSTYKLSSTTPVTMDLTHPTLIITERYLASVASAVALGASDYPEITSDLWPRLGCPYWNGDDIVYPLLSAGDHLAAQVAIPKLLELVSLVGVKNVRVADVFNLLTTLYEAGRWNLCLETDSTAYALAASICFALPLMNNPDEQVIPVSIDIFNQWLKPANAWQARPSEEIVARCLFGTAWYDIAMAGTDAEDMSAVASAILRDRPPFMPGLCFAQPPIVNVSLPAGIGS